MAKKKVQLNPRSVKYLEELGWTVDVTERRKGPVAVDLYGMFDLLMFSDYFIVGVQVTTGSHHGNRRVKILESPLCDKWLKETSRDILILSWRQPVIKGKLQRTWVPREEWLGDKDMPTGSHVD